MQAGLPAVASMPVFFTVNATPPLACRWHKQSDVAGSPQGLSRLQRSALGNYCQKRRSASFNGAHARYTACKLHNVHPLQSVQRWVRRALTRPVRGTGRLTGVSAYRRRLRGGKVCSRSDGALSRTFIVKLARWLRTHGKLYIGKSTDSLLSLLLLLLLSCPTGFCYVLAA